MPASVLAWIAAFGSMGIDSTGTAPIVDRLAPSLTAATKPADKLPPIALVATDVETASRSGTEVPDVDATLASLLPEPFVTAALTDSSEMPRPETPPDSVAKNEHGHSQGSRSQSGYRSTEVLHECFVADT
jgi:hypothetical protein